MPGSRVVVVEGAGDVGSAVAHALHTIGTATILVEGPEPTTTRRRMAFSDAVFDGQCELDGVVARRCDEVKSIAAVVAAHELPLVIGPYPATHEFLAIVDARMRKQSVHVDRRAEVPLFIGLGPGFAPGHNCHLAIETQHGTYLGEVIESGTTLDYDGIPREVAGTRRERQLHAAREGVVHTTLAIGDGVSAGAVVVTVDGVAHVAAIAGVIRGLLRDGTVVTRGARVAELVPAGAEVTISGIAARPRAIAAGVLRALRDRCP